MKKSEFGFWEAEDDLLSKNVRYLRTRSRMSRVTFSDTMNMSCNMLFCLEKNTLPIIMDEALKNICAYYNITPEDLFYTDLRDVLPKRIRKK